MSIDKLRWAVLASGTGSNFRTIVDNQRTHDYKIGLLICNVPGAGAIEYAVDAGIPFRVIDHKQFSSREDFDRAVANCLISFRIDLVALAGFMRILSPIMVDAFAGRMINVHPSLLPKYPGLHTFARALEAGDSETGTSFHFVTREVDAGGVIAQGRLQITDQDTEASLKDRTQAMEHALYPKVMQWLSSGRLKLANSSVQLDDAPLPASGKQFSEGELLG